MIIEEIRAHAQEADLRLAHLYEFLKIEKYKQEMADLESIMARPDFWDDKDKAQETVQKLSSCKNIIEPYNGLVTEVEDFHTIAELAAEDESFLAEADGAWKSLSEHLDKIELVSFLSGRFDRNNCFFFIHAGAGGTESCDWASILMRMYRRWFERKGFKDEIVDIQPGEEAGIKSVTLRVEGEFAYGYLKAERGIHRLVRISPFDSNARRHTSFASADAFPELGDDIAIEIDEKDLKVDTYRSSGAGGQHINKTSSAVRITHLPTGIVVQCQNERSQLFNKDKAMQMLKAKLYLLKKQEQEEKVSGIRGEVQDINFGSQIRSYILHPYNLVKDHRTGEETGNVSAVLDGELDPFIHAYLKQRSNNG